MLHRWFDRFWIHKMPIVLFTGGTILIVMDLATLFFRSLPTFLQPPLGLGLGLVYLVLGAIDEWAIQQQQDLRKRENQLEGIP